MKAYFKLSVLIFFTFIIACKKDKKDPQPEQMWYWDDCKIESFSLHGLNYLIDYNKEGYPGKVSVQHQNLNTIYLFNYQKDRLMETIRLDDNKVNQKVKLVYDHTRLVSVHWFGPEKDPATSRIDTVERSRIEFKYASSEKPVSVTTFFISYQDIRTLHPVTEYQFLYDNRGNVNRMEYSIYIGGEITPAKGTIDMYYDEKPATGKFLNLMRFSYYAQDDESLAALFSENNWIRSFADNTGPSERKLDLEYDEDGNAKSRFYGFSNVKWNCD